jgi:hypothetical protein
MLSYVESASGSSELADVRTLLERADAARKVIDDDPGVDRLLLLAAVAWPSTELGA